MRVSGINDYSFLFNSYSNTSAGSSDLLGSINLTDYNNIKTGGYGKLLKSYYSMETVDSNKSSASASASGTSSETKKVAHKANFLDGIAPSSASTKETKSVNFLDTIVPKTTSTTKTGETAKASETTKATESAKVDDKNTQEEIPVADTSKLLYTMNAGYADASSVLAGNFFNVGA